MTLIMSVVSRSSVADQINFCKNSCILMKLSGTKNTVFHINHYFNMLKGTLLPSQLKPVSFDCLFLSSHLSPVLLARVPCYLCRLIEFISQRTL